MSLGMWLEPLLYKRARGDKHMVRKPRGWALDVDIFQQMLKIGVRWFEILDKQSGIKYFCSFDAFQSLAVPLDRGYGAQLCLPLKYWTVEKPGEQKGRQERLF